MAQPEQSKRAREIFESVLDIGQAEEQAAYVKEACGDDAVLFQRVQALIQANAVGDSFLPDQPEQITVVAAVETAGDQIGRYKLLQKIGEGGMGVVYKAEQEEPVRRRVALKIIKLGMDTRQVVARFEAERQALALMDHANIARVLDGGTTDTGRPYFVMELVQGVPITEFCDKNQLSAEERIKLFIPVCQAIQSAHQKGIIHRDIKPSNVLVKMHHGEPMPKVIDFGVAKATNQKLTEKTLFTNYGTMIGTPAYMSPEQAEMSSMDVDTRSDIYSLGVLLYELLTGTTPFPEKRLLSLGYGEMQRIITQEEPERPSTRLTKQHLAKTDGAANSQIRNPKLEIDADLDWIVMKCLEKDRDRRYETANNLAADIKCFLGNEPVVARPPSAVYQMQKAIQRNKLAFAAAAAIALTLLTAIAFSSWQANRAMHARREAELAQSQAEQRLDDALGFVDEVFTKVAPEVSSLAGAAKAQETLGEAGLNFVRGLSSTASTNPALKLAVAQLLLKSSESQNPGHANTVGDYAVGLQRAQEAAELLSATASLPESEGRKLLIRAKSAAVYCLYGLGRLEEAITLVEELQPPLNQLEQLPGSAEWAREYRFAMRLDAASAMVTAGQVRKAVEEYLQPFLQSEWARNITDSSAESQLKCLIAANDNLTTAYARLNQFDAMLPAANEAVRIAELLVVRFPRNARYAAGRPFSWSQQGYAWLRPGNANEGLALLAKARQEIDRLVRTDAVNDVFQYVRAIVAADQALAFAVWSEENSGTLLERKERLLQAETYLADAEKFVRTSKSKEPEAYLEAALAEVSTARAKVVTRETGQPKP